MAELSTVAKIATFIAFFSATQDIVLDAYRREILTDNELGLGNTIHINAYRDRKSTRLNSSHTDSSRMPSSA